MVLQNMAWRLAGGKGGRGEAFCIHARLSINDDVRFENRFFSLPAQLTSFSPNSSLFPHVTLFFVSCKSCSLLVLLCILRDSFFRIYFLLNIILGLFANHVRTLMTRAALPVRETDPTVYLHPVPVLLDIISPGRMDGL